MNNKPGAISHQNKWNGDILYTPSGRAGEYAGKGVACNLYKGCTNGCVYCYVCAMPWTDREKFHRSSVPVKNAIERLKRDLARLTPEQLKEPIFLCFNCDPYPQSGSSTTRWAIQAIKDAGGCVCILTKNPSESAREWELLDERDLLGVSMTSNRTDFARTWEPAAESPARRIQTMIAADVYRRTHNRPFKLWASFEPVISTYDTLNALYELCEVIDIAKFGPLNHGKNFPWPMDQWREGFERINWDDFAWQAAKVCSQNEIEWIFKNDLMTRLSDTTIDSIADLKKVEKADKQA